MRHTSAEDHLHRVVACIETGLAADEPALVFAPRPNLDLPRDGLNGSGEHVTLLDAPDIARNPARIIPAARQFVAAQGTRRIRVVDEPIWAGRSDAFVREAVRHEALVNVLFADIAADVLCPYDEAGLEAAVIADACRTHPYLLEHGTLQPSPDFADPLSVLSATDELPEPPSHAETLIFGHADLSTVRDFVTDRANGISADRMQDLVLAVNEAASNTIDHTDGPGQLRTWRDDDTVIFEVSDRGRIPSVRRAGRVAPTPHEPRGRGLWIINQLCDLVELRSNSTGTVLRIHVTVQ